MWVRAARSLSFSKEISLGERERGMKMFILKAFSSIHVKIQESTRKYYTFYTNAIFPDFSRNMIIIFTIYTNCKWIKFLVFVFTLNIRDAFPTENNKNLSKFLSTLCHCVVVVVFVVIVYIAAYTINRTLRGHLKLNHSWA